MNPGEWWPLYSRISQEFSFDPSLDYLSSQRLSSLIGYNNHVEYLDSLKGKNVTIVGNGEHLPSILGSLSPGPVIVADSAISAYFPEMGCPDFIVTDLDGDLNLIKGCFKESTIVIHSHGDNIPAIGNLNLKENDRVVGTTQNIPLWNIYNFGGFTDGDRSAFMADSVGSSKITLVAFDFERPNRSKNIDNERKKKKLKWAHSLLGLLAKERGTELSKGDFIEI